MLNLSTNNSVAFGRINRANTGEKKSSNAKKIVLLAATGAAIATGVVYRKNIAKTVMTGLKKAVSKLPENSKFTKFMKNILGMKKQHTIFDATAGLSPEIKKVKNQAIVEMFSTDTLKAQQANRSRELKALRMDIINRSKK